MTNENGFDKLTTINTSRFYNEHVDELRWRNLNLSEVIARNYENTRKSLRVKSFNFFGARSDVFSFLRGRYAERDVWSAEKYRST